MRLVYLLICLASVFARKSYQIVDVEPPSSASFTTVTYYANATTTPAETTTASIGAPQPSESDTLEDLLDQPGVYPFPACSAQNGSYHVNVNPIRRALDVIQDSTLSQLLTCNASSPSVNGTYLINKDTFCANVLNTTQGDLDGLNIKVGFKMLKGDSVTMTASTVKDILSRILDCEPRKVDAGPVPKYGGKMEAFSGDNRFMIVLEPTAETNVTLQ